MQELAPLNDGFCVQPSDNQQDAGSLSIGHMATSPFAMVTSAYRNFAVRKTWFWPCHDSEFQAPPHWLPAATRREIRGTNVRWSVHKQKDVATCKAAMSMGTGLASPPCRQHFKSASLIMDDA